MTAVNLDFLPSPTAGDLLLSSPLTWVYRLLCDCRHHRPLQPRTLVWQSSIWTGRVLPGFPDPPPPTARGSVPATLPTPPVTSLLRLASALTPRFSPYLCWARDPSDGQLDPPSPPPHFTTHGQPVDPPPSALVPNSTICATPPLVPQISPHYCCDCALCRPRRPLGAPPPSKEGR